MRMLLIEDKYRLELGFDVLPPMAGEWRDGGDGRYACGDYVLAMDRTGGARRIIGFSLERADGAAFAVREYRVQALMPAVDVYNVAPRFMGYAHVNHLNPPQITSSSTTKDFPYVIYGSRSGETRLAIGLQNLFIETLITRTGKGGRMYYDANRIVFQRPVMGVELHTSRLSDAIFVCDARESWFDTTRAYWDWIDAGRHYVPNPTPPSAFGPCWCSWLHLTDIDERVIYQSAVAARDLGIKTIMIDAGWFAADTDVPFADSPLTSETLGFGYVRPDKAKFPDMKGLVERIHALGLYVWAWATPRWTFRAVEHGPGAVDARLLNARIQTPQGERVPLLCTRCPDTWEHAAKFTAHLIREYGFDGLKFDCWELDEGMAVCCADHEHAVDTMGEGTRRWAEAIYSGMTEVNPDAVVWFNNTTLKQYSNYSVSPNEVYCQPDENHRMSPVLKTYCSGIVSQLCEGSWHVDESLQNIARHFAVLIMGHVPECQVDLLALPEDQKALVRAWLAFYAEHREQLLFGRYTPFGFEHMSGGPMSTTPPHVRIDAPGAGFIWVSPVALNPLATAPDCRESFVFNLTNLPRLALDLTRPGARSARVAIYGHTWETLEDFAMDAPDGRLRLDAKLPVGAALRIEWVE